VVTSGPQALLILDPASGKELQREMPNGYQPSYRGLDFPGTANGLNALICKIASICSLPGGSRPCADKLHLAGSVGKAGNHIPAGLALSADGMRLYVACNGASVLAELDGCHQRANCSGVSAWNLAPDGVVVAGDKAYVSNLGRMLILSPIRSPGRRAPTSGVRVSNT
jgi:hypothetical protein